MKDLEQNLTKLASKHAALEKRRLLENEGFRTDVKRMRTQILDYQKFIDRMEADQKENNEEFDEEDIQLAKEELLILKVRQIFLQFIFNQSFRSKSLRLNLTLIKLAK